MLKKTPQLFRIFRNLAVIWSGTCVWLVLSILPVTSAYADTPLEREPDSPTRPDLETASDLSTQAITPPVLLTPTNGATLTNPKPTFNWDDPGGAVISYTLLITGSTALTSGSTITTNTSVYTSSQFLANGVYTWTVQAHNDVEVSGFTTPPYTFTLAAVRLVYLPLVIKPEPSECPTVSTASFDLIPLEGGPVRDHPDYLHGDLNLLERGYVSIDKTRDLVDISGPTDSDPPQLAGLFSPNNYPGIASVYQVNSWDWGCGTHGCPGSPVTTPEVTLIGLTTTKGQPISIPERNLSIYGDDYKVIVLYASEKQIILKYTRQDSVVGGYSTNIENLCVDLNLLALYQAQVDTAGYHSTNYLPALRNNQPFGTALDGEIRVTIRDGSGSFLDPRSRKDWWHGY